MQAVSHVPGRGSFDRSYAREFDGFGVGLKATAWPEDASKRARREEVHAADLGKRGKSSCSYATDLLGQLVNLRPDQLEPCGESPHSASTCQLGSGGTSKTLRRAIQGAVFIDGTMWR